MSWESIVNSGIENYGFTEESKEIMRENFKYYEDDRDRYYDLFTQFYKNKQWSYWNWSSLWI